MEKQILLKPEIRTFSSARTFLNAEFQYRKTKDSKFSLETWCSELGYRSKSFLYMVISGKRTITYDLINVLSKNLNLSKEEREYFSLLASYEDAETDSDKKIFLDKILEYRLINEQTLEAKSYSQFLSDLDLQAIKLLLSFTDFCGDTKTIAQKLNQNEKVISDKIQTLENLNLVQKQTLGDKIQWKAKNRTFSVPKNVSEEAVNLFHQKTCSEAAQKVNNEETFKRFRSIYFALEKNQQPEFLEELESFLNKMKNKFGTDQIQEKDLIKLNIQAYSIIKNGDPF